MNLSPHFTLEEMVASSTAKEKGIDNSPTPDVLEHLKVLATALEAVRTLVGRSVHISSGYRCIQLNKLVGGASSSAHTLGYAADISVDGYTPKQLCEVIRDSGIRYDQLIEEYYTEGHAGGWCHISVDPTMRQECLTIRKGTGYMKGIV